MENVQKFVILIIHYRHRSSDLIMHRVSYQYQKLLNTENSFGLRTAAPHGGQAFWSARTLGTSSDGSVVSQLLEAYAGRKLTKQTTPGLLEVAICAFYLINSAVLQYME